MSRTDGESVEGRTRGAPHGAAAGTPDPAELSRRHLGRARGALVDLLGHHWEVESEGALVRTSDGREMLNFGGYGVFFLGARHPAVVAAVSAQLGRHPLATRLLPEPTLPLAAAALAGVTPPGLDHVYFTGAGTEATEAALKLARAHGRNRVVSMINGYHGKTLGALSVTARPMYQEPFQPLLPRVRHVPYGDLEALDEVIGADGSDVLVLVEPVQGEAGVVLPPPGYLRGVADLCRDRRAMLALDEVMTGLGRLGGWWGADLAGIRPDLLLVGKSLSGGVVPCAALVATEEAFAPFSADPYIHTSTFAGAPLANVAATAAVSTIAAEGLVERAATVGATLLDGLRAQSHPGVLDVRGQGLLLAVEFEEAGLAGEFVIELLDRDVVANHSLNSHRVVRFTPPAVVTDTQVRQFLDRAGDALRSVGRRVAVGAA